MNDDFVKSRVFGDGAARYHDLFYVLSKDRRLHESDVNHTSVIAVDSGDWADVIDVNWNSTAIAVARQPTEQLVFVGEEGQVCTYVGGIANEEKLSPAPVMIRRANTISGYVYACGMGRQVYVREAANRWVQMNAAAPRQDERAGFEAIDGFTRNEIYAVGWQGEIWHFDGTAWTNHSGLTNLILTSVCCAEDGVVYVVGQHGLIIKGRYGAWQIAQIDSDIEDDFWDVHWFKGKLYLTTMTGLYVLEETHLDEIDVDDILNTSFYRLSSAEGILWSVGSSDVLSFDGRQWFRYA